MAPPPERESRLEDLDRVDCLRLPATQRVGRIGITVQALARSEAIAASERRRIERNLHDGLQPRFVSLTVDLGIAEAHFERDPQVSRSLIARWRPSKWWALS